MSTNSCSIIIPLYNHQAYISSAIYSAVAQSRPAAEIIIVDDGSTDRSAVVAESIAEARSDIIFWSQRNRGAHNTINAGIQRATGDFVAILNSDDMFEETRLEQTLALLEKNPDVDLVTSGINFINASDDQIDYPWYQNALSFYRACGDIGLSLVNANFIMTTSNFVVRRSLFENIGSFADLRYTHDLDFLLRMVGESRTIEFIEEPLMRYRLHGSNTISEGAGKVRIEWAACVAMYLRKLWSDALTGGRWQGADQIFHVLSQHNLIPLVTLFLAYMDRTGAHTMEHSCWRKDSNFNSALLAVN